MTRIPYFDPQHTPARTLEALQGRRAINLFQVIARGDNIAPEVLALGHKLSRGSSLPVNDREVVILRVAKLTPAAYQAHEHRAVALRHGFTPEKIDAIAAYDGTNTAHLSEFDRTLIEFTDAVVLSSTAPDSLFTRVTDVYDDSRTMELVMTIGFYMMVGRVMNTFEVDLDSGEVGTFDFSAE